MHCLIVYHTEWGAVALGSLDLSLRSVSVSPSNLTADAGFVHFKAFFNQLLSDCICSSCVLAIVTSNLELSLWSAVKNHLKGQWAEVRRTRQVIRIGLI